LGNEGFNDSVGSPRGDSGVCPFCHSALSGDTRPCARCGARQHSECFDLAGGCSVFGCAPTEEASLDGSEQLANSGAELATDGSPPRSARRPLLILLVLCIALPLIAIFGTRSNWFEPFTGKLVTEKQLARKEKKAGTDGFKAGYESGYESGTDDGYSTGYSSGRGEGYTAGCESVFDSLDTQIVYDTRLSFVPATYLMRYQC